MKIAIIGAGLTGLSAANALKEYSEVTVYEKAEVGGLAGSYQNEDKGYWIEKFYHHCFRGDEALLDQINKFRLGRKLVWRTAKTAFASNGKLYPLNTPFEILRYPFLSFFDKIKLARFTLSSKKKNFRDFDDYRVVDGIRDELGEKLFKEFFMPLLRSKFGENYVDVSYAWLLARVSIRSNRKYSGEELGYLRHGFHQLIERMAERLLIVQKTPSISFPLSVNGERYDAIIYTGPIPLLQDKIKKAAKLPDVRYQSSVCALIGAETTLSEDTYWTNVRDKSIFGAIIEHTNFMPRDDYGEDLIYLASYSSPTGGLFTKPESELKKLYLKEVEKYGLKEKDVNWIKIFKAKYSGPIFEKGYLKKVTDYRTPIKNFYVAGMTSPPNYPERSMNGSIKAGLEVAEVVKNELGLV
ncbi:MAG: NAD(P)/FAD-dependent oxidoreductase [Archaeoglobus sp.]|nr:NAD(P)/FAD-dependent oxidoreductase [Archaeoglobus sp.]